jgi:hypothetical protein
MEYRKEENLQHLTNVNLLNRNIFCVKLPSILDGRLAAGLTEVGAMEMLRKNRN